MTFEMNEFRATEPTSAMSRAHGTWKVYNGIQQAQRVEWHHGDSGAISFS